MRAEFGAPHEIYFVNPAWMMVSILGTDVKGLPSGPTYVIPGITCGGRLRHAIS